MEAIFSRKTSEISTAETLEKAAELLADIFVMQFDYENTPQGKVACGTPTTLPHVKNDKKQTSKT